MIAVGSNKAIAVIILTITFAYAIIRYNLLKGVGWDQLPLFISNKAISLSAVLFIGISYALGSLTRFLPVFVPALGMRKFLGLFGFALAALHALISLLIFSQIRYPKFFSQSGNLNVVGELSMLFGILAFSVFAIVAISSIPGIINSQDSKRWLAVQRLGYLGLILVFFHVLTMGLDGWLKPEDWPGKMLPISLVAAIVIVIILLLKITALIFPKNGRIST